MLKGSLFKRAPSWLMFIFILIFSYSGSGQSRNTNKNVNIDFNKIIGEIKPLHGVNGGPYRYSRGKMPISTYWEKAGFPYARLHDCSAWSVGVVNIHAIFPFFLLKSEDPNNYRFRPTDDYIAAIKKNKSDIIYRLGENIEHETHYFNHPPKNYEKWAKVCLNIIRHYNDGWDSGFHYNIRYWEIWNEPDLVDEMFRGGTLKKYEGLYEVTAQTIKSYDSSLLVGGPTITNVYSPWVKPFLSYCRDNSLPLDFFSWHTYTDNPEDVVKQAKYIRNLLDKYGFVDTESVLDEWHFFNIPWNSLYPSQLGNPAVAKKYKITKKYFDEISNMNAATFAASVLILLQDAPVDISTYYEGSYSTNFSMFNDWDSPKKPTMFLRPLINYSK